LENQLYRVEIHTGNEGEIHTGRDAKKTATFKWSRENGSVGFPIIKLIDDNQTTRVWLENLGRDDKFTLYKDDFVEVVDDEYTLGNRAEKLLRVSNVDRDEMVVTLEGTTTISADEESRNHPFLRRWDHKAGNREEKGLTLNKDYNAAEVIEGDENRGWLKLEDGIEIQFQKSVDKDHPTIYRTGDYWLIPARTATGDIEWASDASGKSLPQPPRGIKHHYAPLAIVRESNGVRKVISCRCPVEPHCPDVPFPPHRDEKAPDKKTVTSDEKKKAVEDAAEKKAVKPEKEKAPK